MPEFLDSFAGEVELKRERFKELLSRGISSQLDKDLEKLMQVNWHTLPSLDVSIEETELPRAIAVDGSMARRFFAVGSAFYIVRSLALCGRRKYRRLESDVLASRADVRDIARYINRRSEWVEHSVAREAVEAEDGCRFLLFDGSLHGRLMAVPRDMPHEGHRGFMIEYFHEYSELLKACRDRGVIPIGVSKDSRATLLRDHFLKILLIEELERLRLSKEDEDQISETFNRILHRQRGQRVRRFRALESRYGAGELDRVLQILSEARTLRSDHQMIMNFTSTEGYSTPLELGAFGRGAGLLDMYRREPREYVKRHFPEAMDEAEDPDKFIDEASRVLSEIPSLPTTVSFHVLLDRRDTPIRIDVPSWVFGIDHTLEDLTGFSAIGEVDVEDILSMLKLLFGGIRHYNVLLTSVDSEVRLKRDTVDRIYLPLLEKRLGLPLPLAQVRGYRRGWYVH